MPYNPATSSGWLWCSWWALSMPLVKGLGLEGVFLSPAAPPSDVSVLCSLQGTSVLLSCVPRPWCQLTATGCSVKASWEIRGSGYTFAL